jgi:hypothetical protein
MQLTGIHQTEGLHHTPIDHNPHMTARVPGADGLAEMKAKRMAGERY